MKKRKFRFDFFSSPNQLALLIGVVLFLSLVFPGIFQTQSAKFYAKSGYPELTKVASTPDYDDFENSKWTPWNDPITAYSGENDSVYNKTYCQMQVVLSGSYQEVCLDAYANWDGTKKQVVCESRYPYEDSFQLKVRFYKVGANSYPSLPSCSSSDQENGAMLNESVNETALNESDTSSPTQTSDASDQPAAGGGGGSSESQPVVEDSQSNSLQESSEQVEVVQTQSFGEGGSSSVVGLVVVLAVVVAAVVSKNKNLRKKMRKVLR